MAGFLLRRVVSSLLLLWLLLTVLFFLLRMAPGDPTILMVPPEASAAQRERMAQLFGLDQPAGRQYLSWLSAVTLRGDWGVSFAHRRPVVRVLVDALPNTVLLATAALALDLTLGLSLGMFAARRRESAWDHGIRAGSLLLYSLPTFWLGLMGILLLSIAWPIFPASHMASPTASDLPAGARLGDLLWHLALPAGILALASCGATIRLVRTSLLEVLRQDYIRTARAKGLSERRVLWVHAMRNASVPLLQYVGYSFPRMLNGSLAIEVVFSWPGVGRVLFDAAQSYDYPLVLAGVALSGVLVITGSLLADLSHSLIDPRVRDARRHA